MWGEFSPFFAPAEEPAAPAPQRVGLEIIDFSEQKWLWMSEKNVEPLADLFDDKAMFVHFGGSMTKEEELNAIRSGGIHDKHAEIQNTSVRFIGDTAILLTRIRLGAVVGGNEVTNPFMVTEVYVKQGGRWKLGSLSFTKRMWWQCSSAESADKIRRARFCSSDTNRTSMNFKLNINGKPHQVDVDPNTPLLWVLRDHLNSTGTKYGCGMALCGACTVHLNGAAVRSCMLPVSAAQGQDITTIEGLSENGDHPVQKAWLEHDVAQCGYCQAGQIMSAAALLRTNPNPSEDEIAAAMEGNICRCGTYPRIRKAIIAASKSL